MKSIKETIDDLIHFNLTEDNLWIYQVNQQELSFYKIETPIQLSDSISWLSSQALYPLLYWKSKDKKRTHMGLSSIFSCEGVPELICLQKGVGRAPHLFGGCHFTKKTNQYNLFDDFTNPGFFLPEVEIELNETNSGNLCIHIPKDTENVSAHVENILRALQFTYEKTKPFDQFFLDRLDLPNYSNWCSLVEKALKDIHETPLDKVVLARSSTFSYKENVKPFEILKKLELTTINSTLFAWIPEKETAFIGATPERLYSRENGNIYTEAVAGTRPRGQTEEEDLTLCEELKHNQKEAREFSFVSDFFEECLPKLCLSFKKDDVAKVSKTSTVQHLYESFTGKLKENMTDKLLLQSLHPTPAMGGTSAELSLDFIKNNEPFFRGYYASPLGWISPDSSEFFVGIRSAFIKKTRLVLFSGAGIVNGSDPTKEWEELEHKISHFLTSRIGHAKSKCFTYPKMGSDNYSRVATS